MTTTPPEHSNQTRKRHPKKTPKPERTSSANDNRSERAPRECAIEHNPSHEEAPSRRAFESRSSFRDQPWDPSQSRQSSSWHPKKVARAYACEPPAFRSISRRHLPNKARHHRSRHSPPTRRRPKKVAGAFPCLRSILRQNPSNPSMTLRSRSNMTSSDAFGSDAIRKATESRRKTDGMTPSRIRNAGDDA